MPSGISVHCQRSLCFWSNRLILFQKIYGRLDEQLQSFIKDLTMGKKNYKQVRQLHSQYLKGEITFRRMAKELSLEYRQLYALLEALRLPLA